MPLSFGKFSVNAKGEVRTTIELPHAVVNFGLQLAMDSGGKFNVLELREHWSVSQNERTPHKIKPGETTGLALFHPFPRVHTRNAAT
jgi:hypothetical protein